MRKKIISSMLSALIILSLAGCGRGGAVEHATLDTEEAVTEEVATDGDSTDEKEDTASTGDVAEVASDGDVSNVLIYAAARDEYRDNEEGVRLYTKSYDELYIMDEQADSFSGIKKALESYNARNNENNEGDFDIDEMVGMAQEQYDSYDEESKQYFSGYYDESRASIVRFDESVISIVDSTSSFLGGAHGYYANVGYTYDVQTGEELKLTDVVGDIDGLKEAALEVFSRDYSELASSETESTDLLAESFDDPDTINWSMGPTYLTLYYNPYDIASYAAGMQVLNIRYEYYPDIFNKGYGESEGDWIFETSTMMEDIDGDDSLDYINFNPRVEYNEDNTYSYYSGMDIEAGGQTFTHDYEFYAYKTYIVKRNGNFYLYLVTSEDNDYKILYIYKLSTDGIELLGQGETSFAVPNKTYENGDDYFVDYKGVFCNPDFFYVYKTMSLISTTGGVMPSHISEDGLVEPLQDYFDIPADFNLTSKIDVEGKSVDESGNVGDKTTIPANSNCKLYRSDNENYVDLKLDDGSIVRIEIDDSDYPHTVNGIDIEEAFEGIMFAG